MLDSRKHRVRLATMIRFPLPAAPPRPFAAVLRKGRQEMAIGQPMDACGSLSFWFLLADPLSSGPEREKIDWTLLALADIEAAPQSNGLNHLCRTLPESVRGACDGMLDARRLGTWEVPTNRRVLSHQFSRQGTRPRRGGHRGANAARTGRFRDDGSSCGPVLEGGKFGLRQMV